MDESTRIRQRPGRSFAPEVPQKQNRRDGGKSKQSDQQFARLPNTFLYAVVALMFTTFLIVTVLERRLPRGLRVEDEAQHPDTFIAERAMGSLMRLTDIGPRVAGSYENEVLAVKVLRKDVDAIVAEFGAGFKVEVDVQKVSGAFPLAFFDGMTNVYNDVQNLIVKVNAQVKSPHTLMLNCHFDSVPDSPGASDDGAACAVLLEIMRVVLKTKLKLNYNLVFLFNGAEENIMQASHGFITQHKWAKDVKAFINLEACGAGGRELLFQVGPKNPWLLEVYSQVVPYPYASTLAQEIFQSGVIPGDTDFRVFRDFGHISGVDFAWSSNGYVYHTKYDSVEQIPLGSLQRTGDNILALLRGLNEITDQRKISDTSTNDLIFFDMLGAFMVRWRENLTALISVLAACLSAFAVYRNMKSAKRLGTDNTVYYAAMMKAIAIQILGWILSLACCLVIALSLTILGRTMSWYARPIWIYFLYVLPTLSVSMAVVHHFGVRQLKKTIPNIWTLFQVYYDAIQILWTLLLLMTYTLGIRSGFIALLWVVFSSVQSLISNRAFPDARKKSIKWLLLYVLLLGIPFVQSFYLDLGAIGMFVPTMGRTGSAFNSEIIIATMICAMFGMLFSFVCQLVLVAQFPHILQRIPASFTFLALAVLLLTDLGFPYSGDVTSLAPQRFIISNIDRKFYDEKRQLSAQDAGFWIIDMDINTPESVEMAVSEMKRAKLVDCSRGIYCAMPYPLPVMNFIFKTHYIETAPFEVAIETDLRLVSKTRLSPDTVRLNFTCHGPDHMNLMFAGMPGFELQAWSLDPEKPLASAHQYLGRNMYFVYYSYSSLEPKVWNFHLDFKVPPKFNIEKDTVLDITASGHMIHGRNKTTPQLTDFMSRFPSWTTATFWTSALRSYKY
ncbi:endoplasmic reticulum metallopeptidase 1-like [Phlebotomus argentipes]|uniref:endoplasmic reticulum metallopeptidase 1-like n=1 Tax=Phlebotomus argentipes TaxID=94469 RepID=UPI002892E4BB|nr:endoplasmic reticulum metallopeptidase 1-like [Phlebotomus argentipes]